MKQVKKVFALFLTLALIVGVAIPRFASAYVEPNTVIPDGTYDVSFLYLKDETTTKSAAHDFMIEEGAKLVITDGKAVLEHKVKKSTYVTFAYLGTRLPGAAKAVVSTENNETVVTGMEGYEPITVRDDETGEHVIVQLAIEDVWKKQDVLMHINDTDNSFGLPSIYNHWYNAQLLINTSDITIPENNDDGNNSENDITEELFAELLAEGYQLHEEAVEGNYHNSYPEGSKDKLLNKLQLAEGLVEEAIGNHDILEAAYKIAQQAINEFKNAKIIVDKSSLINWIVTATAWIDGKADAGENEAGKPADIRSNAVTDGEYLPQTYYGPSVGYKGPITDLKEKIAEAQLVVDDEFATKSQVTTLYTNLNAFSDWELFDRQRLIAQDIEIIVLDSLEEGAEISPYAADISKHAMLLQMQGPGYYQAFANFAFYDTNNELTDKSVRKASASNGIFTSGWLSGTSGIAPAVKKIDISNTPLFAAELQGEHADSIKVYQTLVRASSAGENLWQGLWKLQYPLELPEEERKTVYISFNKAYLDGLQQLIDEAEALLEDVEEGNEVGQHSAHYINLLQQSIDDAQVVVDQLSASRPTIIAVTTELQNAIDQFAAAETKLIGFSVTEADNDAFSSFQQYITAPAMVKTSDDGNITVSLKINNSSKLTELKIKAGDQYVSASKESAEDNSDTTQFSFQVDDLSQLLNAQLIAADGAQNSNQTYDIRLNFNNVNNGQLYGLIDSAQAAYDKGANSSTSNSNATIALNALSRAIEIANEEATRIPSQQSTTDEAYATLNAALKVFNETVGNGKDQPGTTPNPSTGENDPVYPANGYYFMPFSILKYGTTQTSVAQDYIVNEALVKVEGSKKTVMFTVLRSKEITGLTVNGSSGSVVKRDSAKNQRVVSFTLNDLSATLNGWVKVDWAEVNYHHEYDIHFKFDESAAQYAGSNPAVPGTDHVPDAPDLPHPDGDNLTENEQQAAENQAQEGSKEEEKEDSASTEQTNSGTKNVQFTDIENHWAKSSITRAVRLGIVNGYEDGSFRPNGIVTRGEFAVMLSRALKLEGEGATVFSDANRIPSWASEHVGRIVAAGILQGFADGSFRADGELTRAQLAVIVARAAKLNVEEQAPLTFRDAGDIPSWAQKEVAAAVNAGLISGKGNHIFDGNGTATRAEALAIIVRLLDYNK